MQCKSCVKYHKQNLSLSKGQCRAHPPQAVLLGVSQPKLTGAPITPVFHSIAVEVDDDYGCWEYVKREDSFQLFGPTLDDQE